MPLIASLSVALKRLDHALDLPLPAYATAQAAAMDLLAATQGDLVLVAGTRCLVPTGIALALPEGFEAQIRARSGLSLKYGLCLVNGIGTIDADYRGEIGVILGNMGQDDFTITRGMRIAQMVIAPTTRTVWQEVQELSLTKRGADGFGSTGHNT